MADPAAPRPLDDLVDNGDTVMLTTTVDGRPSSRPMTVAGVSGDRLDFLVDTTTEWVEDVARGGAVVHVTISDTRGNTYLALNGTATMTDDRAEIDRLWNPAASAFFDGQDDPILAVLNFAITDGQYWDSPSGRIGSLLALVKAAVGGHDDAGDHGPVNTS